MVVNSRILSALGVVCILLSLELTERISQTVYVYCTCNLDSEQQNKCSQNLVSIDSPAAAYIPTSDTVCRGVLESPQTNKINDLWKSFVGGITAYRWFDLTVIQREVLLPSGDISLFGRLLGGIIRLNLIAPMQIFRYEYNEWRARKHVKLIGPRWSR